MRFRLNAAAEQSENAGVRRRQTVGRRRRHCGRAHFGDQATIHHGDRFTGFRPEQKHDSHVSWQLRARVAWVKANQLKALNRQPLA